MKTIFPIALWFCLLLHAFAEEPETISAFEERVKQATTREAMEALVDEAFASKDQERVAACLRWAGTAAWVAKKYPAEPASVFKDKLTVALLTKPWDTDSDAPGRARTLPNPDTFRPYADYIRQRTGETVADPDSKEQLLEAGASLQRRLEVARQFEKSLVKLGHADARTIPDAPGEVSKPGTRPRKHWKPPGSDGESGNAESAEETPFPVAIIGGAAVLLAAAGAYFAFRKKAA